MRLPSSLPLAVVALVALGASPARALPAATSLAHCDIGGGNTADGPSGCSLGLAGADHAEGSLTLSPFVGLNAMASSPAALGIHGAGADVLVQYSFQVTGGAPGDVVPVLIATSLDTLGSDSSLSYAFAALTVQTGAAGLATLAFVCNNSTCPAGSFSGVVATRARSGDTGDFVELHIVASVTGNASSAESASASADPFLFIDPNFPNAGLYGITVSPGVGNAPAPEPGGATLFGVGALALAASSRGARRRS